MKITIDRELLKQRVDALRNKYSDVIYKQSSDLSGDFELDLCKMQRALETSSKDVSAMAQPQREPVDALDNPRPVGEITWGGCVSWNGSIPDYGTDLYTAPPARKPLTEQVLVPLDVLEAAEISLGSFCGNHGWSADDMQTMDNLSAYIAKHKAAHGIK